MEAVTRAVLLDAAIRIRTMGLQVDRLENVGRSFEGTGIKDASPKLENAKVLA